MTGGYGTADTLHKTVYPSADAHELLTKALISGAINVIRGYEVSGNGLPLAKIDLLAKCKAE